jgi:hypothetical protein
MSKVSSGASSSRPKTTGLSLNPHGILILHAGRTLRQVPLYIDSVDYSMPGQAAAEVTVIGDRGIELARERPDIRRSPRHITPAYSCFKN